MNGESMNGNRNKSTRSGITDGSKREESPVGGVHVVDNWLRALFNGNAGAESSSRIKGKCGDTIEIQLAFDGERIRDAQFRADGCAWSAACGAAAAQLAKGRTIDEAAAIDARAIIRSVQGLPEGEDHCAQLAAEVLQNAIHNHLVKKTKKAAP
ncbi:MAG: iron-sulfur cluster assembly scaffold protein [Syntrophobacteraceae bacterium]